MIDTKFLLAGRAVFTIENDKNEHYTFKINRSKDGKMYFVHILTGGHDNFTYMGVLQRDPYNTPSMKLKLTKASKMANDSKAVKVINFALRIIEGVQPLPLGYSIEHEGQCGACGRALTDPESIRTGLGPICRGK